MAATGQPTISGTAQVGEDLTASTSGISDANGLTNPSYDYQWLRAGTATGTGSEIAGGTSATYTVVEADQGKYLRVRVSFQDDDGNDETATSDATGPVAAEPNVAATGQPTISGTAQVGGGTERWSVSGISDGNGLTNSTYRLPVAACGHGNGDRQRDSGSKERDLHSGGGGPGQVPPSAGELPGRRRERRDGNQRRVGTGGRRSRTWSATGQPTISGTAQVGERSDRGHERDQRRERPDESVSYGYQWLRGETAAAAGSDIPGATERDLHSGGGGPEQVRASAGELPGRRRELRDGNERCHGAGGCRAERGGDRPADDQRDGAGRRRN